MLHAILLTYAPVQEQGKCDQRNEQKQSNWHKLHLPLARRDQCLSRHSVGSALVMPTKKPFPQGPFWCVRFTERLIFNCPELCNFKRTNSKDGIRRPERYKQRGLIPRENRWEGDEQESSEFRTVLSSDVRGR